MKSIYEKDGNIVGVNDRYVYLEEIFEYTPNSWRLADSKYISCAKPLSLNKAQSYKRFPKEKRSLIRDLTLLYAPEQYLIDHEYTLVEGSELLKYTRHAEKS